MARGQDGAIRFGVLGPTSLTVDGSEIALGGTKRRALLAILLLHANRPVSAERLVEDLWVDDAPPSSLATLRAHISHLRKLVGSDRLVSRAGGYELIVREAELDAAAFQSEVNAARTALGASDPAGAADGLTRALGRWRGAALADADGAAWAVGEAARLDELRAIALETLLEARLVLGDHADVVALAEAAVSEHPLRERLWAQLMTALYRCGRQAEALRAYQRVRAQLAEELGIEPGEELVDLERRVLEHDPALGAPRTLPPETGTTPIAGVSLPSGVVTFLLTDVVGSTRLWEKQPDAMPDALARHDHLLRTTVESHGGVFLKARGEGDSTFSVFRRASDAAAAALAAQRFLTDQAWPASCDIRVRMALHTGEAHERDGDYYGRTVNRVARLRDIAKGGQVLVAQSAAEIVVDHLPDGAQLVSVGAQTLADLDRPETVYRLDATAAEAAPPADPQRVSPMDLDIPLPGRLVVAPEFGFFGRQLEIEALIESYKQVAAGATRRLVVVSGEPGIGKTTLAAEVARAAHADGAIVLYGRCDVDVGVPYQPFAEALDHYVTHAPQRALLAHVGEHGGELARVVPALGRLSALPPARSADADTERYLLFAAVVGILRAVGAQAPVVLVLDDLHWADRPTLSLLRHLVAESGPMTLLAIATYRASDLSVDHPLAETLAALRRESGVERLDLAGWDDLDIVARMETEAGRKTTQVGVELAHALRRETDGNPFFVNELLRHVVESGWVERDDAGRLQLASEIDVLDLPQSVREVVGQRVARLGEEARRVLTAAAVIGRDFDLDLLAEVMQRSEDELLDVLDRAAGAALVGEVPGTVGRYSFAHALYQHTLYQDLGATRAARAHQRVANALEQVCGGDPGPRVTELAHHFAKATQAGDPAKTIDYSRRAGEAALAALAPDEAVRWFAQGLDVCRHLPSSDERLRAELLIGLGIAQRQTGDTSYRETLLEAAGLARRLGDTDRLVRAALANNRGAQSQAALGIDVERTAALEAALAATSGDTSERALLMATLVIERTFGVDRHSLQELADEATAMARRLREPETLARVLYLTGALDEVPDRLEERLARSAEMVELAAGLGDPMAQFSAALRRARALITVADLDEADHHMEACARLASQLREPYALWVAAYHRSWRALLAGRLEEAEQRMDEIAQVGRQTGQPDTALICTTQLRDLRRQQGRLGEVQAEFTALAEEITSLPVFRPLVANLYTDVGEHDRARALFEIDATAGFTDLPYDPSWLYGMVQCAEVCAELHDVERAASLYGRLAPFHHQVSFAYAVDRGAVALYLAMLARVLDRPDDAEAHLAEAMDIHMRLRAPFWIARTELELARVLLARGAPGDPAHATELLDRVFATARQFGFADLERRATALTSA